MTCFRRAQRLKGVNDALKATEEIRYRAEASRLEAQRVAKIGVWEYDPQDGQSWWSTGMYELFGLTPNGTPPAWDDYLLYFHEEDRPLMEQMLSSVLKTGKSGTIDTRILTRDGETQWIHCQAGMVFPPHADSPKLIGHAHDISGRKLAEERLRENARHNEALLRVRRQLEVARDYDEVIDALHQEIQQTLGYKACWLYLYSKDRKTLHMVATRGRDERSELSHLQSINAEEDAFAKALIDVQDLWVIPDARTHELTDKDTVKRTGNRVIVNMPIRILGQSLGVIGAGTFWEESPILPTSSQKIFWEQLANHTASALDRIKYYQELHDTQYKLQLAKASLEHTVLQRNEELAELTESMQHFLYLASHDLQEPLRMVISYLQLLDRHAKEKFTDTELEFMNYAINGAFRMKHLLDGILSYSRLTTHAKVHELVDMNEVLETVLGTVRAELEEKHGSVELAELPTIQAEPRQMLLLFQQLIDNALKFHGECPPSIQIGVEAIKDGYQFFLKDHGIGFEQKDADRIFNMFQRLLPRTQFSGQGVGLALCARIVQLHHGKIWAESTSGKGSTFYFTVKSE